MNMDNICDTMNMDMNMDNICDTMDINYEADTEDDMDLDI